MTSWNKQRVGFPAWVICYSDFSFSTLAILNKCIILTVVENDPKMSQNISYASEASNVSILIPLVHLKKYKFLSIVKCKVFKDRIYETTLCNFYLL